MKRKSMIMLLIILLLLLLVACKMDIEKISSEQPQNTISSESHSGIDNEVKMVNNTEATIEEKEIPSISPIVMDIDTYCNQANWQDSWYVSDRVFRVGKRMISNSASSTLNSEGDDSYYPSKAHDFDLSTAWIEGAESGGIGERINYTINSIDNYVITHIDIINGYTKSDYLWEANSRIKKLRVWLDGKVYAVLLLEDTKVVQRFQINEIELNIEKELEFEILEIYEGSQYADVAITEIQFSGNTENLEEPRIIEQGAYEVTMILEDGTEGMFWEIAQDNILLNINFTKPANRKSVEEVFEENFGNLSELIIEYNWINDQTLNIYISNLNRGKYNVQLTSAKDSENFDFLQIGEENGYITFYYYGHNHIVTLDIETKEINERTDIVFPNSFYYASSVSPYSDHFSYENYGDNQIFDTRVYTPIIYDNENGWIEINNDKPYEDNTLIWLNHDLVYINNDIFNIQGKLIKTLNLDGHIVGIQPSLNGNEIAVFASEIGEPLMLYIFDSNCNELIKTITMPFTYATYRECNHINFANIEFFWIDNESIVVEGWNNVETNTLSKKQIPSVYIVNTFENSIKSIKENTRLENYFGDSKVLIIDYSNTDIVLFSDYYCGNGERLMFDIDNKDIDTVPFLNDVWDIDITSYKNYIIYKKDNSIFFYDLISKSESYIELDGYVYILGIKDGLLYLNVKE